MEHMLKKMKKKGEESSMPEHEKQAKMSVLSHLCDMAQESMGSKLHGLKKVSVMSDSKEGLDEGLDKAHQVLKQMPEEEESPEEESLESPEQEMSEGHDMAPGEEECSPEELDAKIAHLQMLKQKHLKRGM
jgi:cbb3-type cytochrome oxidase cytochrome c subunit